MTKGEKYVVLNYTPLSEGQKENIKTIKELFAKLIDDIDNIENANGRLKAMVQTKLEDTCMYFVKLLANKEDGVSELKTVSEVIQYGDIVTGKQIGRASCRERVSSPV